MPNEEVWAASALVALTAMTIQMTMSTIGKAVSLPREGELFEVEDQVGGKAGDEAESGSIDAEHDDSTGNGAGEDVGVDAEDGDGDGDASEMDSQQLGDGEMNFERCV